MVFVAVMGLPATWALADGWSSRSPGGLKDGGPGVERPYSWSGIYVGLHGGYSWTDVGGVFDSADLFPVDLSRLDIDTGVLGAHIGAQYQAGRIVLGIEADISGAMSDDSFRYNFDITPTGFQFGAGLDYLMSIRGRLGYAFDNFLIFGTVGWSRAEFELSSDVSAVVSPGTGNSSFSSNGAVYGGGLEYKWTPNVILRAEYLHYDIGKTTTISNPPHLDADFGDRITIDDIDVARLGISFILGH
jgi:outer membrane immunogenic protein